MSVLVALDSFKGSLTSEQANQAVRDGIRMVNPTERIDLMTVADGGEGTVSALRDALKLENRELEVLDSRKKQVVATYGINRQHQTAVIEVSAACGLPQVPIEERNARLATSYGVGQLILDAIKEGSLTIYVGLGGSATTDGGFGMLRALGGIFFDAKHKEVTDVRNLSHVVRSDSNELKKRLRGTEIVLVCDVENPFYGETGAAHVYAPQKGATPDDVLLLDERLKHFAKMMERDTGVNVQLCVGSGAAGGIAGALYAYAGAKYTSGAELVLSLNDVPERIANYALVISGEGKIDEQTLNGKLPLMIGKLGAKERIPVVLLGGSVNIPFEKLQHTSVLAAHSIASGPMSLEELMKPKVAYEHLKQTAAHCYATFQGRKDGNNDFKS
ncbi:glycerate kinase [Thalassospira sp. MA62]|nr:glycerate kinase [Thalassospira sp. MA62]